MAKMNIGKDKNNNALKGWIFFLPVIMYAIGLIVTYFTELIDLNVEINYMWTTLLAFIIYGCLIRLITGKCKSSTSKLVLYLISLVFLGLGIITGPSLNTLDNETLEIVLLSLFPLIAALTVFLTIMATLYIELRSQDRRKKSYVKKVISDEYVDELVKHLGGENNIITATNSVSRLKVKVKDVDEANLEGIQELSKKGVFVAGQDVQIIFSEEAVAYLEYYINNKIK